MTFYFIALAFSAVFHEMGHALAAVGERKHINGVGAFVLFVYPGAFVDLREDTFVNIAPWKQLKIACAGAWHNFVLSLLALVIASIFLPLLLTPFYHRVSAGVVVTSINVNSVLEHAISTGDVITSVNGCSIDQTVESSTWRSCLLLAMNSASPGHCHPRSALPRPSSSCDDLQHNTSLSCFSEAENPVDRYVLHPRDVVKEDSTLCYNDNSCGQHGDQVCLFFVFNAEQPQSSAALETSLPMREKLLRLSVRNKRFILFVGHPSELWNAIEVDEYETRKIPFFGSGDGPSCLLCWIPSRIKTFLVYLASLSSALGLINIAPIFYLDGHWVISALAKWAINRGSPSLSSLSSSPLNHNTIDASWCRTVLISGTSLLGSNILLSIVKMLLS